MAAIKPDGRGVSWQSRCAGWNRLDHYWVRRPSCSGRFSPGLSSNYGLPGTPDHQRLLGVECIHAAGIHSCGL